jgi:hypothetical protein
MKGAFVVSETELFKLTHQVRPHKQWFEIVLDITAWQRRSNLSAQRMQDLNESVRELNRIFDYLKDTADAGAGMRWQFWTRERAEAAITYARLKWE